MLTVKQVSDRLSVNPETVRRLIKAVELKGLVFGTGKKQTFRIDEREFEAFIDKASTRTDEGC